MSVTADNGQRISYMFKGILPPIPTPFKEDEVAYDRLAENLTKLNRTKLAGYVILGTNSEPVHLTEQEKLRLIETARKVVPKEKVLLVGTGLESTQGTIQLTNKAAELGADGVLVVSPSFYKNALTKSEVLYKHYMTIADKAKTKVLLYNIPQCTGINLEADLVARLAQHPNIVGIKDSSGNIAQLSDIVRMAPAHFSTFTGSALVLLPALCVGAVGGIVAVANVAPDEMVRIQELYQQGDLKGARQQQFRMTPLAKGVTVKYGIGGLKAAMDLVGYYGGKPRSPLPAPSQEEIEDLKKMLREVELI